VTPAKQGREQQQQQQQLRSTRSQFEITKHHQTDASSGPQQQGKQQQAPGTSAQLNSIQHATCLAARKHKQMKQPSMKAITFREALLLVANAAKLVAAAVQYMTCDEMQAW
jgi:hypothetical protein